MLSKNSIKFIKSLQIKKFRKEYGQFLVEGRKSVLELLKSDFEVQQVITTEKYYPELRFIEKKKVSIEIETEKVIEALGAFEHNNSMVAVAKTRDFKDLEISINETALVLDGIQDPGNLGTIIRTADWFGITKILCSETTAEFYNPKVISATMGSFTRVKVFYGVLEREVQKLKRNGIKVYGTLLSGENLQTIKKENGLIIIGNEANGISKNIIPLLDKGITIAGHGKAESLNAAVATGIILHHFMG